ncbi:MAG: tol-pal system-associated acyl-CoA thioesterase [Burkholderiaceae bacterium]|nr:tol-pal system-associated acyl-CoA thioesterase [Burkholderiaceae bacterium]
MHSNFNWNIRVYYEDTDAGGIVFYANYLKFLERARTEWLRAAGVNQQTLRENHGVIFVVKNTTMDYHVPAQLDDELRVTVVVRRLGRASVQFVQEAWRTNGQQETLLVSGEIKVGCVDAQTLRPCEIPETVSMKLKA